MLNQKQTDCRFGGVAFAAGEDLSLKTGYLAKLNAGGDLVLPQGAGEITPYVLTQGADQGYLCGAVPLTSAGNCRVKLAGTCEAGDLLVAKGDGRAEAGAIGGGALPIGTAEERGVDGQHVLLRPLAVGTKGADGESGADGPQGADGAQGPAGAAGEDGGAFHVPVGLIAHAPEDPSSLAGKVLAVCAGPAFDAHPDRTGALSLCVVSGVELIGGAAHAVCCPLWSSVAANVPVVIPASAAAPCGGAAELSLRHFDSTGYCGFLGTGEGMVASALGAVVLKVAAVSGRRVLGFTYLYD